MHIPSYQIQNVLKVYSKQLSQQKFLAKNKVLQQNTTSADSVTLSSKGKRQAIIEKVATSIIDKITMEGPRELVEEKIKLPSGYSIVWSGQYEYMEKARKTLNIIVPATLLVIFLLLYIILFIFKILRVDDFLFKKLNHKRGFGMGFMFIRCSNYWNTAYSFIKISKV